MTLQNIVTDAFRELLIVWPGQTPSPDQSNEGLTVINRMVANWNTQRAFIYVMTRVTGALVGAPPTQSYPIGPGAAIFSGVRPLAIHEANIITATGAFGHPLKLTDETILAKPGRSRTAQLPLELWYQPTYPQGTLWRWPIPNVAATLELFIWSQLAQFATLGDTFDLPPGYELAIVKNLAVLLAPRFQRPVSPDLMRDAVESKAAIALLNGPPIPGLAEELEALPQAPQGR